MSPLRSSVEGAITFLGLLYLVSSWTCSFGDGLLFFPLRLHLPPSNSSKGGGEGAGQAVRANKVQEGWYHLQDVRTQETPDKKMDTCYLQLRDCRGTGLHAASPTPKIPFSALPNPCTWVHGLHSFEPPTLLHCADERTISFCRDWSLVFSFMSPRSIRRQKATRDQVIPRASPTCKSGQNSRSSSWFQLSTHSGTHGRHDPSQDSRPGMTTLDPWAPRTPTCFDPFGRYHPFHFRDKSFISLGFVDVGKMVVSYVPMVQSHMSWYLGSKWSSKLLIRPSTAWKYTVLHKKA